MIFVCLGVFWVGEGPLVRGEHVFELRKWNIFVKGLVFTLNALTIEYLCGASR